MSEDDFSRYRPNVGVVLFNRDGRVWLGHRVGGRGARNWQFPQGGIDPGEDLETAARRELREETGVTSAELLGRVEEWITYDFPPAVMRRGDVRGFKGQRQAWLAMRFTGEDGEIDLAAVPPIEFDRWRWASLEEAERLVVPFKRATYARVIEVFRPFAEPASDGG